MTEPVRFQDAEEGYSFKTEGTTFKEIVLQHVKKIGIFASCEFRGGYWMEMPSTTPNRNSGPLIYIADTRETYSNAVEYLHDILYPHFDKEMLDYSKLCEQDMKKSHDTFTVEPSKEEESGDEEIKQRRKKREFANDNDRVSYRIQRLRINRKLFREICCFLKRKNYLDMGFAED